MGFAALHPRTRLVERGDGGLLFRSEAHPVARVAIAVLLVVFFACTWIAPFAGEQWFRLLVFGYGVAGIMILGRFREHEFRDGELVIRSRALFVRRTRSVSTAEARLALADRGGSTALVLALRDGSRETVAVSRDEADLAAWVAAIGELLGDPA